MTKFDQEELHPRGFPLWVEILLVSALILTPVVVVFLWQSWQEHQVKHTDGATPSTVTETETKSPDASNTAAPAETKTPDASSTSAPADTNAETKTPDASSTAAPAETKSESGSATKTEP